MEEETGHSDEGVGRLKYFVAFGRNQGYKSVNPRFRRTVVEEFDGYDYVCTGPGRAIPTGDERPEPRFRGVLLAEGDV